MKEEIRSRWFASFEGSLKQLLEKIPHDEDEESRHDEVTIHVKNLQKLVLEVYKELHHLNPSYLWENFQIKSITYYLRKYVLCQLPQRSHKIKHGISSLIF